MAKIVRVLLAALVLTSVIGTASAQEQYDGGGPAYAVGQMQRIAGLQFGADGDIITAAYTQYVQCDGWDCTYQANTVCVGESANECHPGWSDTRQKGHSGNALFVNGPAYMSSENAKTPLVVYTFNAVAGNTYSFSLDARNVCKSCENHPEMSALLSVGYYLESGAYAQPLIENLFAENRWVGYSVEFVAQETGTAYIAVHSKTFFWAGNDSGFRAKASLVETCGYTAGVVTVTTEDPVAHPYRRAPINPQRDDRRNRR